MLREWGSKVWVRTEKKDKLGGQCVEEGRWIGVDVKSKGIRVYWPKKRSVTMERNLYWNEESALSDERIEGEDYDFDDLSSEKHSPASDDSSPSNPPSHPTPPPPLDVGSQGN
jgi:hypothetical protein